MDMIQVGVFMMFFFYCLGSFFFGVQISKRGTQQYRAALFLSGISLLVGAGFGGCVLLVVLNNSSANDALAGITTGFVIVLLMVVLGAISGRFKVLDSLLDKVSAMVKG